MQVLWEEVDKFKISIFLTVAYEHCYLNLHGVVKIGIKLVFISVRLRWSVKLYSFDASCLCATNSYRTLNISQFFLKSTKEVANANAKATCKC